MTSYLLLIHIICIVDQILSLFTSYCFDATQYEDISMILKGNTMSNVTSRKFENENY